MDARRGGLQDDPPGPPSDHLFDAAGAVSHPRDDGGPAFFEIGGADARPAAGAGDPLFNPQETLNDLLEAPDESHPTIMFLKIPRVQVNS